MSTTTETVKLSRNTLSILKNFSHINSNLLVKEGNILTTISPAKNIVAEATIDEYFHTEFGIWDLSKLLGTISCWRTFIQHNQFNFTYIIRPYTQIWEL